MGEYLTHQVIYDECAARLFELCSRAPDIRCVPERQGRQAQAHRPPLGRLFQQIHGRTAQLPSQCHFQQRLCLLCGETQVIGTHFTQFLASA